MKHPIDIPIKILLLVAISFVYSPIGRAGACQSNGDIAIGGVSGFADLANPVNTHLLRLSCRTRLYLHWYSWKKATPDIQQAILTTFKGMGSPIIEIDRAPDSESYFKNDFVSLFTSAGVKSTEAEVNNFNYDHPLSEWTKFVDAGRKAGLSTLAPVFSPNTGEFRKGEFNSPVWDNVRAAALYGGGLTIDAPSDFFFSQEIGYQNFTIDEIRWANSHHIRSTVIVSPGRSGDDFLNITKKFLHTLRLRGAAPSEYVVENYKPFPPPGYKNNVGSETGNNTILSVALWMIEHAETRRVDKY